jgi:hypothetical protein
VTMAMMPVIVGVFMLVCRRLVSMFRFTVAMGYFLMGMLMLMLLFFAHG